MSDIKQREVSWDDVEAQSAKKDRGLLFRLVSVVSFVALFCLVMNTLLNYIHFTKTYENIIKETFYTQAENVASNLEAGLKLGISLPNLSNGKSLLEQAQQRNSGILFLTLEARNNVIHHVGDVGRCKPEVEANYRVVLYEIHNSFGQIAGQLCLGYDPTPIRDQESLVLNTLLNKTGLLFLVVVVLLGCVLSMLTRKVRKELRALYLLIKKAEQLTEVGTSTSSHDGHCDDESEALEMEVGHSQLNLPVKAFCEKVNAVVSNIDNMESDVK